MIIQIISFFFLFIVEVLDNFAQSPAFVAVANHTAIYGYHQVLDICASLSTILRENDLGYYFIVIVIPKRQWFSAFPIQSNFYRCMKDKLRIAVMSLDEQERHLIEKMFLTAHPMTEEEYARLTGKNRGTIHYQKMRILGKLKSLLEK